MTLRARVTGYRGPPPPQASSNFGFGMGLASYFGYSQPYNNIAKYQSPYDNYTTGNAVFTMTNGDHVSGEAQYTIWVREGEVLEAGTYVTTWTGTGTVANQSSPGTLTVSAGQSSLTFGVSGQIQGLSIVKQGASGTYTQTFTDRASRGSCIRFMDAWRTNDPTSGFDNTHMYVRDPTPTGANEFRHKLLTATDIANIGKDHGCDIWINLHHLISDANVTQIASDINATGFSGTVYVEHSNEVWNSSFPVYQYGKTQIGGYGGPGEAQNIQAWHADRTHTLGGIFKATIAGAVVVWGSQLAVPNYIQNSLDYAQTALTNIDACAVAPYFGGPWSRGQSAATILSLTDQQIANSAEQDLDDRVKPLVSTWLTEAGLRSWRLLGYEGGSHLDHSDSAAEEHLATSSNSAEMGAVYGRYLDYWDTTVNDLICIYQDTGSPADPWSHLPTELSDPSPRWEAWLTRAT